jgi:hypothetical protein
MDDERVDWRPLQTKECENMRETHRAGKIRPWVLATSLNSRNRTGKRGYQCFAATRASQSQGEIMSMGAEQQTALKIDEGSR